jgi:hypothetical protein
MIGPIIKLIVRALPVLADAISTVITAAKRATTRPPPRAAPLHWTKHQWPNALAVSGPVRCELCRTEWSSEVEHGPCPGRPEAS